MRVSAYRQFPLTLTITAVLPRAGAPASTLFTSAKILQDWSAKVGALLREYKHVGESALSYPAAQRLQSYFPSATSGQPLYALRLLEPAGVLPEVDDSYKVDLLRRRYNATLDWLPAAFSVADEIAEAMDLHLAKAVYDLFAANSLPVEWIPGMSGIRDETAGLIDIIAEVGPPTAKSGVDIQDPS